MLKNALQRRLDGDTKTLSNSPDSSEPTWAAQFKRRLSDFFKGVLPNDGSPSSGNEAHETSPAFDRERFIDSLEQAESALCGLLQEIGVGKDCLVTHVLKDASESTIGYVGVRIKYYPSRNQNKSEKELETDVVFLSRLGEDSQGWLTGQTFDGAADFVVDLLSLPGNTLEELTDDKRITTRVV